MFFFFVFFGGGSKFLQYMLCKKKQYLNMKKKTYIFAHMSVKPKEGGGAKALADMTAKNVSFFQTAPLIDNQYVYI